MFPILFDALLLLTIFCVFGIVDLFLITCVCHNNKSTYNQHENIPNAHENIWLFLHNVLEWKYFQFEQPKIRPACIFYILRWFVLRSDFVWEEFWHTAFLCWQFLFFTLLWRYFLNLLIVPQKQAKFHCHFWMGNYSIKRQFQNFTLKYISHKNLSSYLSIFLKKNSIINKSVIRHDFVRVLFQKMTLSTGCPEDEVWKLCESLVFSRIGRCFNSYQNFPFKYLIISMMNLFSCEFE